jgi:PAS domain S-box-containing protein
LISLTNTKPQARVDALAKYRIMDTSPEPEFDGLTRFASSICEAEIACISLLDGRRQWLKSCVGTDAAETPIELTFCAHSLESDAVMVVEDASRDSRFRENPMVTGKQHIRFYAGAPLITEAGVPLGAICVLDRAPRSLTKTQERALQLLAGQTMTLLEKRRLSPPACDTSGIETPAARIQRCVRILEEVSEIAGSTSDANTMLEQALYAICSQTGWSIGHAWLPDQRLPDRCKPLHIWRADRERRMRSYRAIITGDEDACRMGMLGQVMETRSAAAQPASQWSPWRPQYLALKEEKMAWGVALPIVGRETWGALEFFSACDAPPDAEFCEFLTTVGRTLGRGIERQRSLAALKLSEAYFRHLTEESLDLVTVLDARGMIRYESRSLAVELGWTPDEMLHRSAFEFVHPDDCADVLAAFTESLRTEGPTALLSFRFRHRDGSYRMLEGRGNNLLSDPAVGGVVFSSRDISEKKRLEDQFGQLAGGVAHDFNNLLTVIVGYSSVAEAHPDADQKLKGAVAEIRRASEKAAGLTGQLLASTGRQVMQPRVVPLDDMLRESSRGLAILLEGKIGISLSLEAPEARIRADVAQFDLVLRNLALNAYDAMPAGGEIHLGTSLMRVNTRADAAQQALHVGDYAVLTFRDTGCGMTPEICVRALEPYFTTKPRGKGTGLGLSTCHGIVRQSGGRITVQSEPGAGTTVTLYLPLVDAPATDIEAPVILASQSGTLPTILFAEDEEILRELGTSVLEELGYRVLSAENGRAALELLDASPGLCPDLLLTDIIMPEMDGKALAEAIRKRSPSTPILFCSGYAQDPSFYQGLPEGTAFLPKPYTVSALAENVNKLLRPAVSA